MTSLGSSVQKFGMITILLSTSAFLQSQSAISPTASEDPERIDQLWQKASSKYDSQRAALLNVVDSVDRQGPFRADWESLQKYEAPEWYRDAKFY